MIKLRPHVASLSGISALLCTAAVHAATPADSPAQPQITEILVTASKMGVTNLQDTPLSITAFTADTLDKSGIKDIRDLAGSTPNLVVAQNTAFAQIYIRGVGSNNIYAGSDPSTTLHVDGVYIARPVAAFSNFLDVERIEVLRGPQGTLYGRNSLGGTINVISRLPDDDFQLKAQLTTGNYGLIRGESYISGPIIEDKLAVSLSAMASEHDGYFKNIVASGNDRGSEDAWGTRLQVRATPTDALEMILRADYLNDTGISVGNQALLTAFRPVAGGPMDPVTESIRGNWHKVALNDPSTMDRTLSGVSGEINYELSPAVVIKSLSAYRESDLDYANDTDATDLRRQITSQLESQRQLSQELNVSGVLERFKYVTGLYYFEEDINASSDVIAYNLNRVTNAAPTVNTRAWAGYGQGSYDLTERLTATAGIRYTDEKKDFDQHLNIYTLSTGASQATYPRIYLNQGHYKAWTPKFGVDLRLTDDVMLYTSATRGFKSGGFNYSSGTAAQGFAPETMWAYEVGIKSEFADRRVRLNASGFYYDYKNLQVQSFLIPGLLDITNASNAKVKGLELELLTRPVAGLDLGGSITTLDATYQDYPQAPIPGVSPTVTFDASGKTLNSAPKLTYNLFGQYTADLSVGGSLFVRGEYSSRGRQYFTAVNDNIQTMPDYSLINASIGYTSPDERWQALLFGRNLANTEYLVSTGAFTAVPSGTPGDPRTYGIRLIYTY